MSDNDPGPAIAERAAIVDYLRERARWLREKAGGGGHWSLNHQAIECETCARLILEGRHHQGGH